MQKPSAASLARLVGGHFPHLMAITRQRTGLPCPPRRLKSRNNVALMLRRRNRNDPQYALISFLENKKKRRKTHALEAPGECVHLTPQRADDALGPHEWTVAAHYTQSPAQQWSFVDKATQISWSKHVNMSAPNTHTHTHTLFSHYIKSFHLLHMF